MALTGTPLQLATAPATSALQSGSWLLALLLAAIAAGLLYVLRRGQHGTFRPLRGRNAVVRRLGSTRLSPKVTLEVVEFEGQRLLLSVSDRGAQEITRAASPAGERAGAEASP